MRLPSRGVIGGGGEGSDRKGGAGAPAFDSHCRFSVALARRQRARAGVEPERSRETARVRGGRGGGRAGGEKEEEMEERGSEEEEGGQPANYTARAGQEPEERRKGAKRKGAVEEEGGGGHLDHHKLVTPPFAPQPRHTLPLQLQHLRPRHAARRCGRQHRRQCPRCGARRGSARRVGGGGIFQWVISLSLIMAG